MAQQLRLKSQKYSATPEFAYTLDVYVDTGVAHLDQPFSYLASIKDSAVQVGSLVNVPFGTKILPGIVVGKKSEFQAGLKFIKKVVHLNPVLTPGQFDLIEKARERWTGNFWDFARFALPQIPAKATIPKMQESVIGRKISKPELKIGSSYEDLIDLIKNRVNPGRQLLIIVPNVNLIKYLQRKITKTFTEYGSHLDSAKRFESYLEILSGSAKLIISTRGGTWLPLQDDAEILVVDDLDFAFYESRAPFWNVRDLVLIRASSYAVTFYSHSPSLELLRLSKTGWLSMSSKKRDRVTLFYSNGRLGYQSVIKDGLKSGSVLVLTPERGYVNSIVCAKCRNQYRCKCGGNLIQTKSASKLECALCGKVDKRDKCNFCGSELKLSFKKGIEKTLEELGKQFPGALIQKFNGEFKESNKNSIVISNYSTIPLGDFQAIVALGFERFAYQNQLRATEVARKVISDLIAMQPKAIFMDCESNSYFANFANAPTSIQFAEIELKDRKEVGLPPFSRIALIDCDLKTAQTLEEQDFIKSLEFVNGRAYLKSNIEDGARLSSFLNNLLKYRSLRRLKAWTVKVDPLDL